MCPNDGMPFAEVCRFYRNAASSIDAELTTVFLTSPTNEPEPDSTYLHTSELKDTRAIARQIDAQLEAEWDLVLCHRYRAYWADALSNLDNKKCVAVAHEFGMLRRWQRRASRKVYAREIAFAGVSPAVTDELARSVPQTHTLPNGLDLSSWADRLQTREAALAGLGLDPGPFTIGVVGRLHYKKRPELALAAYRQFRNTNADSRLVFIGDGELQADDPEVHLLGRVDDARYLFAAFDVLLMTATEDEAFGMVALEALAAGVPVVTASIPGPKYVLEDLGFYAQTDSVDDYVTALKAVQRCDRAALLDAGRQRISKEFSLSATARRLDDLLVTRRAFRSL